MMNEFDVSHEDILAVIRPSGPVVDQVVDLMARLVEWRLPTSVFSTLLERKRSMLLENELQGDGI